MTLKKGATRAAMEIMISATYSSNDRMHVAQMMGSCQPAARWAGAGKLITDYTSRLENMSIVCLTLGRCSPECGAPRYCLPKSNYRDTETREVDTAAK